MIREFEQSDLDACAEILMSAYNNETWQCLWSAPDFYRKNGFCDGEHVLFMYKVV